MTPGPEGGRARHTAEAGHWLTRAAVSVRVSWRPEAREETSAVRGERREGAHTGCQEGSLSHAAAQTPQPLPDEGNPP